MVILILLLIKIFSLRRLMGATVKFEKKNLKNKPAHMTENLR